MEESRTTIGDRLRWAYYQMIYFPIARLRCRLTEHDVRTEYRADAWTDPYGESYCIRCGENL